MENEQLIIAIESLNEAVRDLTSMMQRMNGTAEGIVERQDEVIQNLIFVNEKLKKS